jgi:hypothetical protein
LLLFPEFAILIAFGLGDLQEDGCRGLRESFAHPLVAITAESDRLSPPLVRYLMGSYDLPVHIFRAEAEEVLLRLIEKAADG